MAKTLRENNYPGGFLFAMRNVNGGLRGSLAANGKIAQKLNPKLKFFAKFLKYGKQLIVNFVNAVYMNKDDS